LTLLSLLFPRIAPPPFSKRSFLVGVARGGGGALLFSLPMLMTMEMWALGFTIAPERLVLLLLVLLPLLVLLAEESGFEETQGLREKLRDAVVAFAIGILVSAVVLAVFGLLTPDQPLQNILGMVAIQSVPASIGALLARSQLGGQAAQDADATEDVRYLNELALMAIGALFLGLNVAPTEEVILIAFKMSPWHALGLILLSLAVMHGFVFALGFRGSHAVPEGHSRRGAFWRFTLPGYAIGLLVSLYVLWTFGRTDGVGTMQTLMTVLVLGLPAAVGAASARLVL
jgi:putative integral membrane protein (TIGR02587 family)